MVFLFILLVQVNLTGSVSILYKNLKKQAPSCARAKNTAEKVKTSELWKTYHQKLNSYFPIKDLHLITQQTTYLSGKRFLFSYYPSLMLEITEISNAFLDSSKYLLEQQHSTPTPNCTYHSRRFSRGVAKPSHMGFYEQNLPKDSRRIWNLYESTSKPLLLLLRPIIRYLSDLVCTITTKPPVDPGYGLFGSIFTSLVVNPDHGEWHIDPKDKLAVIVYFGDFQEGKLLLAPPISGQIPVSPGDVVIFDSSSIYHKAMPFKGHRISISFYSKKTTRKTPKGTLYIKDSAKWAVSPN